MIKKNEKGFALILSLILLMVMSLMGGSLVVIASSDHRGNNSSDEYQQAFYVAETGLLEGEKDLINYFMGAWVVGTDEHGNETGLERSSTKGSPPSNSVSADTSTPCYKSFKNITLHGTTPAEKLQVVKHIQNVSFYELVEPIFDELDDSEADSDELAREKKILEKYTYEYFMVNIGKAAILESGSSIASTSVDIVNEGTAFRIYACGIFNEDDVIIPLESVMVLPG
jgi:Tfp pilus assembly protein PilX